MENFGARWAASRRALVTWSDDKFPSRAWHCHGARQRKVSTCMNADNTIERRQSWLVVLPLVGITLAIESAGVGQFFAFLPLYLERVGVAAPDVARWVG